MRNVLLILFLFSCYCSFGQIVVPRANGSITVQDYRAKPLYNQFIPTYADTTAANLQSGIDSLGAVIYTYDVQGLWVRKYDSGKKWVELATSGGPTIYTGNGDLSGNRFVNLNGNSFSLEYGVSWLTIIPATFQSAMKAVDNGTGVSFITLDADNVGSLVQFSLDANNGGNQVNIVGSATLNRITHSAAQHIFIGVLEFADNAAAISGGLVVGAIYRTGDLLKIVH